MGAKNGKKLEIYSNDKQVGELNVFSKGQNETYHFSYCQDWLENGYEIDPKLPLSSNVVVSKNLWSCFADISPDRWGQLVQKRKVMSNLTQSEYMLGVSDYFRIGSLRIKEDGKFVSEINDIPKLTDISELINSSQRIEKLARPILLS